MTLYVLTRPIIFSGGHRITQSPLSPQQARDKIRAACAAGHLTWCCADRSTADAIEELTGLEIGTESLRTANRPRIEPVSGDSVLLVRLLPDLGRRLDRDERPDPWLAMEYLQQDFAGVSDGRGRPAGMTAEKRRRVRLTHKLLGLGWSIPAIAAAIGCTRAAANNYKNEEPK